MIVGSVDSMASAAPPVIPAPVAAFDYTPIDPLAGYPLQFNDRSTNNPTSWSWTYNGSLFSTQQNPTLYFGTPQRVTIALMATNQGGSNTFSQFIQIERADV